MTLKRLMPHSKSCAKSNRQLSHLILNLTEYKVLVG